MYLEPGLREKKKSKQKIEIMNTLVEALETRSLNSIKIDELCGSLEISKVTFFNYFQSKEEVLYYFTSHWNFKIQYHIYTHELIGKKAIEYIFTSIGEHKSGFNIMMAIVQYLVKNEQFNSLRISDYEYYLYNNKVADLKLKPMTLLEIFEKSLECYDFSPEKQKKIINQLVVGFYGVPIKSKISDCTKLTEDYSEYIEAVFSELI